MTSYRLTFRPPAVISEDKVVRFSISRPKDSGHSGNNPEVISRFLLSTLMDFISETILTLTDLKASHAMVAGLPVYQLNRVMIPIETLSSSSDHLGNPIFKVFAF